MSTTRAVARDTTRLLAGLLAAKALDFAFYLFLARALGVEQFGRYTFAISFTLLFNILADLGVATIFTREAARTPDRTRALLAEVLRVKFGLALATMLAATGIAIATGAPRPTWILIAVMSAAMLANSSALLFENLLKAAARSGVAGVSVVAQSVTALVVGAALVLSDFGALGGAIAYLAAAIVHLVAAAAWSRDLWRRPAIPPAREASAPHPWGGWTGLVKESAPLALSGAFIVVYFRIDSVLLHAFRGESVVGLYGGAYRFFEAFVLLSAAYRSVLFPYMARAADGPAEALGVLCRKSLRLHLMFTVGVAVFFTLQAHKIVTVLLGPAYAEATPALAILMWALPGAFMADTLFHLLAAQHRQATGARALAATATFNVIVNLIVIPRFAHVWAAAVTVASEVLAFTLLYAAFRASVPKIGLVGVARGPLIAGSIAAATLILVSPLDPGGVPGLALMGTFAISAYLLALVGLGALDRQDAELAFELLPGVLRPRRPQERRSGA